jgi:hypothetical protein
MGCRFNFALESSGRPENCDFAVCLPQEEACLADSACKACADQVSEDFLIPSDAFSSCEDLLTSLGQVCACVMISMSATRKQL